MRFIAAEFSRSPSAWSTRLVIICGTLLSAFALAEITERRKGVWRAGIVWLWHGGAAKVMPSLAVPREAGEPRRIRNIAAGCLRRKALYPPSGTLLRQTVQRLQQVFIALERRG